MHTTLYTLFMPPPDCFGDFGLMCGFTATPQVLRQIRSTFAGELARPALAIFIHPTVNAVSDIGGLAWMWMRLRDRGYNLLHAKVALLGFRRRTDDGYVVRLVVSTGNWTEDPLTGSVDLFWSIDVDINAADMRDIADLRAAWAMFDWLRERADCTLIERDYDGHRPDARLAAAISQLPPSTVVSRFIDSREHPLFPQVVDRIGTRKKANRLILGSGYFESAGTGDAGLPERLRRALERSKTLSRNSSLDLFLNPQACQGIASRAAMLADAGWILRRSISALHGEDARLHAKFVLLASGDKEVTGRLYLGSGNLSRNGFETAASAGGNLEAGVVVDVPEGLSWRGRKGICSLLPIQFSETVTPNMLQPGDGFIHPDEPVALPPVSWLVWQEGELSAPKGLAISVVGPDGTPSMTPCRWPAPAPTIVTLADSIWRLPVISGGVLVLPRTPEMTIEDVLVGLGAFPEPPDRDQPEDGAEGCEPLVSISEAPDARPSTYAIRRMMSLLVRLAELQARIDPRDWHRWCRELRQNLCAITSQEQEMIGFFRRAGANPITVLADPRMRPDEADCTILDAALAAVANDWKLSDLPSLWAGEAA